MRKLALLLPVLLLSFAAHAAPATDADVDALLAASKAERLSEQMMGSIGPMMQQVMARTAQEKNLGAEQQRALEKVTARMIDVMKKELSWAKLRPLYTEIYKDVLTHEEIEGMVAFYQTPAGAAMLEKMPLVMQKTMTLMQQRMGPMMKEMEAAMREAAAEAKAGK